MRIERAILHLMLSTYYAKDKDAQIVKMAKRYLKKPVSGKVKKPLKDIINSSKPAEAAQREYEGIYQ